MNGMNQSSRDRRHAGFSLIELLIVATIAAIMTAIAAPNILAYMRNYSVKAGTSAVVSELQRARLKAVQRNTNNGMVFVVTSRRQFRIYPEDANPPAGGGIPPGARQQFNAATAEVPKYLPQWVEFVPATVAPGTAARTAGQLLRFNRLGQTCEPGAVPGCAPILGTPPPPQVPGTTSPDGSTVDGSYFVAANDNSNWSVEIEDVRTRVGGAPGTGLRKRILISAGGRVWAQQ